MQINFLRNKYRLYLHLTMLQIAFRAFQQFFIVFFSYFL